MSYNTTSNHDLPTIPASSFPNTTTRFCQNCDTAKYYSSADERYLFEARLFLSQIILLIFIIIFTVLGNTLVLVATWKERILHQPNKYFIACLAVADLLVGTFVAPSQLFISTDLYIWYNSLKSPLDLYDVPNVCRVLVWMDTLLLTTSIYTLTFISFDRYLKISKPLQYKSRMTTSISLKIIFIIWLISSCFATYAASPSSGSMGMLFVALNCDLEISASFYIFLSISTFLLPTIIILIMYALIFVAARKRRKMLRNGLLGQTNNEENQRNTFFKDLKVIRMLLIVVGVFFFCWGPLVISLLLFYLDPQIFRSSKSMMLIYRTVITLALFNSACNPIIYACFDQTYRNAFKHLFQRVCRPNSNRLHQAGELELRPTRTRLQNV